MKNYVKEYKGYKVPEGATHWQPEGVDWYACFIKYEGDEAMFRPAKSGTHWEPSYGVVSPLIYELPEVELPEVEQRWIPTHQLINSTINIFKGTPAKLHTTVMNRIGAEISIIELFGGDIYGVYSRHLTKIKTQQEKDREEFIDKVLEEIETKAGLVAPDKAIFEIMYEAGARFK